MAAPKFHGESMTTDEKRSHLRAWALEAAGGDPARLPTIREARAVIKNLFGDSVGAGLGTDVITKLFRELRDELNHKRLGAAGVIGHIEVPSTPGELMDQVGRIAQMMKAMGLSSLAIDADGFPVKFERFQK
jgi:hypothetical protein